MTKKVIIDFTFQMLLCTCAVTVAASVSLFRYFGLDRGTRVDVGIGRSESEVGRDRKILNITSANSGWDISCKYC